jgi:hypothetical protein
MLMLPLFFFFFHSALSHNLTAYAIRLSSSL